MSDILFFQPRRDSTWQPPNRCTCHELTGGQCAYCVMPMPAYTKKPEMPVRLEMTVVINAQRTMRSALSDLLRKFAEREAGPVGIRLRQVADVFEEAA